MQTLRRSSRVSGRRKPRPRFDVVGFGALNLDRLYRVPELIRDGGVEVSASTSEPGGSAANTAYGLAKLGLRCGFVGAVGDDDAGKAVLESFDEVGVDTSGILVKRGAGTGETICVTAGEGQKAIYILPGANDLLAGRDVDRAYLGDTRHVHVSSFVGEAQFERQCRTVAGLPARVGVSLSLDSLYARRGMRALRPILKRCSVLFANLEELHELTGRELYAAADACLDAGCRVVVVTFGGGEPRSAPARRGPREAKASVVLTRQQKGGADETIEHAVPARRTHRRPVVDTVGAGDSFAAGFLFGLLATRFGLAKCGALGHTAAQFSLRRLGARKGLPARKELLARLAEAFPERRRTGGAVALPSHGR